MSNSPAISPVSHACVALRWDDKFILTDPVGSNGLFLGLPDADMILLTDVHPDHFDIQTLRALIKAQTTVVLPPAVAQQLPADLKTKNAVLANDETKTLSGFQIAAVPMYNVPQTPSSFHPKGRGNGYVIEKDSQRVYISGDTSGTPEMRALKNIDIAFVCMNLPYTMDVQEAATAVLAFKPKQVIPYHYRTPQGFSDTAEFKRLVNKGDPDIQVNLLNFYQKH
ncbi:MAG: MBL fold metallo-hydrolase [Patescibacteria group bacterium]|nr:MBL fold metallo-hydrolase [Patescibacteria group bacterium]